MTPSGTAYVEALIRCMSDRPLRVRCATLRTVFNVREEPSLIADGSMPHGIDAKLMDDLSSALSKLNVVHPDDNANYNARASSCCYLRPI